ncbi:MAG: YihY family inner membrane protein [Verrucomicrobia bacterium]|nr:YihY family inner membrane protein [Verrucomicrobiota bacterium]
MARETWRSVALFLRNRGPARASALAYTTLLALVPLLAISLSVSALFLPREEAERRDQLLSWIEFAVARSAPALGLSDDAGQPQRALVAANIAAFVERIHFKTIGAAATFGLLVVVIGLLRTVETAFNDIWGVSVGRSLGLSIVCYWAAITLGPLVLLAAQIAVYLPWVTRAGGDIQRLVPEPLASVLSFGLMPSGMALAFMALYASMPNTRVPWRSALGGGLTAAVLWTLNGQLAALYNTRVLMVNTIYGSLGVLPLFLAGLYLSWVIVLFGAQVAYVIAHPEAEDLPERLSVVPGIGAKAGAAVHLMIRIGNSFAEGKAPPSAAQLSAHLGASAAPIPDLLQRLEEVGLIIPTAGSIPGFTLGRPPESIRVGDILRAVHGAGSAVGRGPAPMTTAAGTELNRIQQAAMDAADSITLATLLSPRASGARGFGRPVIQEAGVP